MWIKILFSSLKSKQFPPTWLRFSIINTFLFNCVAIRSALSLLSLFIFSYYFKSVSLYIYKLSTISTEPINESIILPALTKWFFSPKIKHSLNTKNIAKPYHKRHLHNDNGILFQVANTKPSSFELWTFLDT